MRPALTILIPRRIAALLLIALCARAAAGVLPLDPPESFFTNLADQLLEQQLGVHFTDVQIAPTNQYDSAVETNVVAADRHNL